MENCIRKENVVIDKWIYFGYIIKGISIVYTRREKANGQLCNALSEVILNTIFSVI